MKKVLILIPSNRIGGIEKACYNLERIFRKNYDTKVVVLNYEKSGYYKGVNQEVVNYYNKKNQIICKLFDFLKIIIAYNKIKKKFAPNIVITGGGYCNLIEGITRNKKSIAIATIHSIQSQETRRKGGYSFLCNMSNKYFLNKFNKVISISYGIKEDLLKTYPNFKKENHELIYNSLDIKEIKKKAEEKIDDNEKSFFCETTYIYIGRISEEKAILNLVKCFYNYYIKNNKVSLLIIGDGDNFLKEKLKKEIAILKMENIIFLLGQKENPYKYLRKADVLVLSSKYEGMPTVLLEALILNKKIVTTNSSLGIYEILLNNQLEKYNKDLKINIDTECGIITPLIYSESKEFNFEEPQILNNNEKQFIDALDKIRKKQINKIYSKKVLENFSDDLIIGKFEKLWE